MLSNLLEQHLMQKNLTLVKRKQPWKIRSQPRKLVQGFPSRGGRGYPHSSDESWGAHLGVLDAKHYSSQVRLPALTRMNAGIPLNSYVRHAQCSYLCEGTMDAIEEPTGLDVDNQSHQRCSS